MFDITTFIQQISLDIFIFLPIVILLGALLGLEPRRSKTLLTAFIIAIKGTSKQAIILGIFAAISQIIFILIATFVSLYFLNEIISEKNIWFFIQISLGLMMFFIALWMMRRSWNQSHDFEKENNYHVLHPYTHTIDTGHGLLELKIYNRGEPPRFRLSSISHDGYYSLKNISLEIKRPDGFKEKFSFKKQDGFLESEQYISGKFEFIARLSLFHEGNVNNYDVEFTNRNKHLDEEMEIIDLISPTYHSAEELAQINDIRKRFASKNITTSRIMLFGLKAGFMPSPTTIVVFLLCLELQKITPAIILILCFTISLATIISTSGKAAGTKRISKYLANFGKISDLAAYISSVIILIISCYIIYHQLLIIK